MAERINRKSLLSQNQRIIADNYEGGEYSYCKTVGEAMNVGDGLFAFLISELSENQDCGNFAEAINRLDTIKHEIDEIQAAFGNADGYRSVCNHA